MPKKYTTGSAFIHLAHHGQRTAEAMRRLERNALLQAEKSKPCTDCGGTFDPACMEFDHRPGEGKRAAVSKLRGHGIGTLIAEIAKCDLVCANCHRIRSKRRGYPANMGKRLDLEPARVRAREVARVMTELVIRECAGARW